MCAGNERAFVFNGLTFEQWERRKQQIIRRAEAARGQALRGLVGAVLRGLRTAAWARATCARRMMSCLLRSHWSYVNPLRSLYVNPLKTKALSFRAHIFVLLRSRSLAGALRPPNHHVK